MTPKVFSLSEILNPFNPDLYADELVHEDKIVWCVPEAKEFPFVRLDSVRTKTLVGKPAIGGGRILVAYSRLTNTAAVRGKYLKPLRRYWYVNPTDVAKFDDARERSGEIDLSKWDPDLCPVEGTWTDSIQAGVPAIPAYPMLLALSAEAGNYKGKRDIPEFWSRHILPIYAHLRRAGKEYRQTA